VCCGFYVCYRHSSEPELSLWRHDLGDDDGVAELQLASAAGAASEQPCNADRLTDCSVSVSTCADVGDLPVPAAQFNTEKMATEETGASNMSCSTTGLSTESTSSGGLKHGRSTDAESASVSEKQDVLAVDCGPFAGAEELPVVAARPQNSIESLARGDSATPVKSQDCQTPAEMDLAPLDPGAVLPSDAKSPSNEPIASSLSADSEAVDGSSVKTAASNATSDSDLPHADDNCTLDSQQFTESLSAENVQPSASEPHMVCNSLLQSCSHCSFMLHVCEKQSASGAGASYHLS